MFHSIIVFQGNKLFKEGKYELAKAKYEKVLIFLFFAKLNLMLLSTSVNIFLIENCHWGPKFFNNEVASQ